MSCGRLGVGRRVAALAKVRGFSQLYIIANIPFSIINNIESKAKSRKDFRSFSR